MVLTGFGMSLLSLILIQVASSCPVQGLALGQPELETV